MNLSPAQKRGVLDAPECGGSPWKWGISSQTMNKLYDMGLVRPDSNDPLEQRIGRKRWVLTDEGKAMQKELKNEP